MAKLITEQEASELGSRPFGKKHFVRVLIEQLEPGQRLFITRADVVEMVYVVATSPPVNPAACNKTAISSKARFSVQLDIADAGKKIFAYLRWKNNTSEEKSGPWASLLSATVAE